MPLMNGERPRRKLGEILVARGVPADVVAEALRRQSTEQPHLLIGQVLVAMGAAEESDVLAAWAEQLGLEYQAEIASVDAEAVSRLGAEWLSDRGCVPLSSQPLRVAMADPEDAFVAGEVRERVGPYTPVVVPPGAIRSAIETWMRTSGSPMALFMEPLEDDASVTRWVDHLLERAVEERASDVHLEALGERSRVRFRIDGVLYEVPAPPLRLQSAVVSRLKVLSDLNIAERRLPQDGKFPMTVSGRPHDVRVSVIPGVYGEGVVLRLLERTGGIQFDELGFSLPIRQKLEPLFRRHHGLILATGPTGSGKTTTLYAALQRLNDVSRKIVTIEDPVEYDLPGVEQIQVHPKINLTFASGLRSILRHDPDIILVGEIRDAETASIAIQAALTGHLVPTTLHTNDAVSSVARLLDMGVERFLVASALIGVVAQRLVRRICLDCREEVSMERSAEPLFAGVGLPIPKVLFRGKGCLSCRATGYRGRVAVGECLVIDEGVREAIHAAEASTQAIREAACQQRFLPLLADGLDKARSGETTIEEVLRVALPDA